MFKVNLVHLVLAHSPPSRTRSRQIVGMLQHVMQNTFGFAPLIQRASYAFIYMRTKKPAQSGLLLSSVISSPPVE